MPEFIVLPLAPHSAAGPPEAGGAVPTTVLEKWAIDTYPHADIFKCRRMLETLLCPGPMSGIATSGAYAEPFGAGYGSDPDAPGVLWVTCFFTDQRGYQVANAILSAKNGPVNITKLIVPDESEFNPGFRLYLAQLREVLVYTGKCTLELMDWPAWVLESENADEEVWRLPTVEEIQPVCPALCRCRSIRADVAPPRLSSIEASASLMDSIIATELGGVRPVVEAPAPQFTPIQRQDLSLSLLAETMSVFGGSVAAPAPAPAPAPPPPPPPKGVEEHKQEAFVILPAAQLAPDQIGEPMQLLSAEPPMRGPPVTEDSYVENHKKTMLEIAHTMRTTRQGGPEWLSFRRVLFTASLFAPLSADKGLLSRESIYTEKVHQSVPGVTEGTVDTDGFKPSIVSNVFTEHGRDHESDGIDRALKALRANLVWKSKDSDRASSVRSESIVCLTLTHADLDSRPDVRVAELDDSGPGLHVDLNNFVLGCSYDGLVHVEGLGLVLLEIKCLKELPSAPESKHWAQVQGMMRVLHSWGIDVRRALYVVWQRHCVRLFEVNYNHAYATTMERMLVTRWHREFLPLLVKKHNGLLGNSFLKIEREVNMRNLSSMLHPDAPQVVVPDDNPNHPQRRPPKAAWTAPEEPSVDDIVSMRRKVQRLG